MGCWASWISPGLAAAVLVLSAGLVAGTDSRPSSDRIAQLLRELGSGSFVARERATRELTDLGIVAREALAAATNDPDAEVRVRARAILATVSESDFRNRLEAFASDYDGRQKQTLPGWEQFSARFGPSRGVRELFVEMQRAEPELLEALTKGGKPASDLLELRCHAIMQHMMANPNREGLISLGTMASLLFVGSTDGVDVDEQTGMQFYGWIYQPVFQRNTRGGSWSSVLKKLLGTWIVKDGGSAATFQNLMLAASFELKSEGLTVATRALANEAGPAPIRQYAILSIGRFGGKEHLPMIEKCLQDTTNCNVLQANNPPHQTEIQIRDVALAVLVHLTGQHLRDYGYVQVQPNPQTLFQVGTLAFNDAARREAALKKWSQWRAEHPEP
ncbi:MAG: hypothetical protein HY288_12710 [Planctomycetia bacterium]|nr:hypothetical protein [Planctomycetia bacterium]